MSGDSPYSSRYRFILIFMAIPLSLISTGCIQEQNTAIATGSTPVPSQETMPQVLDRVTCETQDALDALNATVADAAMKHRTTGISGWRRMLCP